MSRWSRIARVFRPDSHQDEIREEIEFHLAMDQASGHDPREARLRLGNPAGIREEVREAGIATWLESVLQDARYGLRQFRRSRPWGDSVGLRQLPVHRPRPSASAAVSFGHSPAQTRSGKWRSIGPGAVTP